MHCAGLTFMKWVVSAIIDFQALEYGRYVTEQVLGHMS